MKLLIISLFISLPAFASIVLIGDAGKDNQGQLDVSRSLQEFCAKENCTMGIMAGDNVYPAGVSSFRDPILETMFDKYYNNLKIPFLIALGNHDYGHLSNSWFKGYYQLQHAKKNPLFHLPHYYYIHETAETVFAVIDTTRLMWMKDINVQGKMMKQAYERAQASKKWLIVIGHHPYLSNGKHGNAGKYDGLKYPYMASGVAVKTFLDKHVCNKAQFYLAGHDHSLQVINGNIKGCNTQLIVSGTAASATKLFKRNQVEFESTQKGFFHLNITADKAHIKAINDQSEVMFQKIYLK